MTDEEIKLLEGTNETVINTMRQLAKIELSIHTLFDKLSEKRREIDKILKCADRRPT